MRQQLSHVEANAARAQDRHRVARSFGHFDGLRIGEHTRVVHPDRVQGSRLHAGGQDHMIVGGGEKLLRAGKRSQPHFDPELGQPRAVICDGFGIVLLARNPPREIELPADPL